MSFSSSFTILKHQLVFPASSWGTQIWPTSQREGGAVYISVIFTLQDSVDNTLWFVLTFIPVNSFQLNFSLSQLETKRQGSSFRTNCSNQFLFTFSFDTFFFQYLNYLYTYSIQYPILEVKYFFTFVYFLLFSFSFFCFFFFFFLLRIVNSIFAFTSNTFQVYHYVFRLLLFIFYCL